MSNPEHEALTAFLDHYRGVARRKADGLSDEQLRQRLPGHPSPLSVGAIAYHLASVEDWWFTHVMLGADLPEPWASGWAGDDDYDFHAPDTLSGEQVLAQLDASVAASRRAQAELGEDLDQVSRHEHGKGRSYRWVLIHLVEEYARHCGHLDLLREGVDGATGD